MISPAPMTTVLTQRQRQRKKEDGFFSDIMLRGPETGEYAPYEIFRK